MRRIYEMGMIFVLMLVSMNVILFYFSGIFGITVEFSNLAPTQQELLDLHKQKEESGTTSILNNIATLIWSPIDFILALTKSVDIIYILFFSYETILNSLFLPTEVVNALKDIFGTIVLIVITAMIADFVSVVKGGGLGG